MEPTLDKLDQTMREAEIESHEGKRNVASLAHLKDPQAENTLNCLPLLQAESHSRKLYEYCVKGYADKNLMAKWNGMATGEPMLPVVHSDMGHQFWDELHLPGPQKQAGSGPDHHVHMLRLSGCSV